MSETKYFYPIDFDVLAADLEQRGIDIAPTRITWLNLARCIATHAGEQGREAFHRIAAVTTANCATTVPCGRQDAH